MFNQYLFFIGDYLNGKPVYPTFRRILNVLFSISITSFLFEKFYFRYTWYDISNYKAILDFFIKGQFFIPFCIFIIVHYTLDYISGIVFSIFTVLISSKMSRNILNYKFSKSHYKLILKSINNNPVITLPERITDEHLRTMVMDIQTKIPEQDWAAFELALTNKKAVVTENFKLFVKTFITITIYFFTIPHFGWLLYTGTVIILLILLAGQYVGYLMLDIVPAVITKFQSEMIKFINTFPSASAEKPNQY